MSNNNIIGERIKELREQAKEKQWGLAKKINVSPVEVCRYEKNERKPSVRAIIAIAKHYNVSADYILGLTNNVKTPCDLCRYAPPSSSDGKPCCMCPATD